MRPGGDHLARESTVRSPPRSWRRCPARPGCAPGRQRSAPDPAASRPVRPARRRPACGWPPARCRARRRPVRRPAPRPPRGRATPPPPRARPPIACRSTAVDPVLHSRREPGQRSGDRPVTVHLDQRRRDHRSRKISRVPPDRHGLCTVNVPVGSAIARRSSVGVIRSSSGCFESSSIRLCARTVVSAQVPPTNPSMDPSAWMIASSPAFAEVGLSRQHHPRPDERHTLIPQMVARTSRSRPAHRDPPGRCDRPTPSCDRQVGPHRSALHRHPHIRRGQRHVGVPDPERGDARRSPS